MFKIVSSVGRSWPAHDFHISVGDNDFAKLTEGQLHFMQAFVDAGMMTIVNLDAEYTPEQRAKIDDTVKRIRDAAAIDMSARRALELKAVAERDAGLTGPRIDGSADAEAEAKAKAEAKRQSDESDARAKAEAEAKAKAEADAQAKGKKSGG